jgi:hypothetical protein
MVKSSRAVGIILTICLAFSSIGSKPAYAGDDTELAKQLWAQGRVLANESSALTAKMQDAVDRGDWDAVCSYAREARPNSQAQFDLTQRMSDLDLDPQNAAKVQQQLANARAALESADEFLKVPECSAPESSDADKKNEEDMDVLNVGVATARKVDAEGSVLFAAQRWSVACSYLTVAQLSYANNSRFALELSGRFSDENNPQPQLARLSSELAGLETAVTSKRDIACKNEKLGG